MNRPQRYVLVIRADRTVRVARKPRLRADEVGIAVDITYPEGWGTIVGNVDVTAPDFLPEVRFELTEPTP